MFKFKNNMNPLIRNGFQIIVLIVTLHKKQIVQLCSCAVCSNYMESQTKVVYEIQISIKIQIFRRFNT